MRTVELLRRAGNHNIEFHFCILSGMPGSLDEEVRRLGGVIHYCPLGYRFAGAFRKLIRTRGIDVVHSHVHMFSGVVLALAKWSAVPVRVAHFRSSMDGHGETVRRAMQRRVARWLVDWSATHILAVSEATMRDAWGDEWKNDKRCGIVYNGIAPAGAERNSRRRLSVPEECFAVIHVGRMDAPKNHTRVVSIFHEIYRRRSDARLYLIGREGTESDKVRAAVAERGIEDIVTFVGEREDVATWLAASDVMLFPSLWEGLPGAVLEASASGLPVIATDLEVIQEVGRHLPLVTGLSLNLDDAEWARVAVEMGMMGRRPGQRGRATAAFHGGPFELGECLTTMAQVWNASG